MAVDNISKFYKAFSKKYKGFNTEQEFRDYIGTADTDKMTRLYDAFNAKYKAFDKAEDMFNYLGWTPSEEEQRAAMEKKRQENIAEGRKMFEADRRQRGNVSGQGWEAVARVSSRPTVETEQVGQVEQQEQPAETSDVVLPNESPVQTFMQKGVRNDVGIDPRKNQFANVPYDELKKLQSGEMADDDIALIDEYEKRKAAYDAGGKTDNASRRWLDQNKKRYNAAKRKADDIQEVVNAYEDKQRRENIGGIIDNARRHTYSPSEIIARGINPWGKDEIGRTNEEAKHYNNTIELAKMAEQTLDQGTRSDSKGNVQKFIEGAANNVDRGSITFGASEAMAFTDVRNTAEKYSGVVEDAMKEMGYDDKKTSDLLSSISSESEELERLSVEIEKEMADINAMKSTLDDIDNEEEWEAYAAKYNQKVDRFNKLVNEEYEPLYAKYEKDKGSYESLMTAVSSAIDSSMTDGEKALMDAFAAYSDATESRANISIASKAGAGAEQSAEFMIDFILTGGLESVSTKLATKLTTKHLVRKLGKDAVKNMVYEPSRWATFAADALVAAERTALMFPRNLQSYGEQLTQYSGKDQFGRYNFDRSRLNAALNTALTQYIEYWSEGFGKYFGNIERDIFRGVTAAAPKVAIGKTLGAYRGSIGKYLDYGKFDGMFNEMLEEVVGSTLNATAGWLSNDRVGDKNAMRDFWSGEQLATLALSFLPMSAISARTNISAYNKMKERYEAGAAMLKDFVDKGAISKEDLDNLVSSIPDLTPEEIKDRIVSIADAARPKNDGALPKDFAKNLMGYIEGSFAMNLQNDVWEDSQEKMSVVNAYTEAYTAPNAAFAWDMNQVEQEAKQNALTAGFTEEQLEGNAYMLAQQAMLLQSREPERADVLLEYAEAKAANTGLRDGYNAVTEQIGIAFDNKVRQQFAVNGFVTRATLDGKPVFIVSDDATVTNRGKLTTPTGENGEVMYIAAEDKESKVQHAKASAFEGASTSDVDSYVDNAKKYITEARNDLYTVMESNISPTGMSRTLGDNIGNTVFINGKGAYAPVTIERLTNGGQKVVISGDKNALMGVATAAKMEFPGGKNLEINVTDLYPLLAKNDDDSLTVQKEVEDKKVENTTAEEKPEANIDDIAGKQVRITEDGNEQVVNVISVNGDEVRYQYEDEEGNPVNKTVTREQFIGKMNGTEVAPSTPSTEQEGGQQEAITYNGRPVKVDSMDSENGWVYYTYLDDKDGMQMVADLEDFKQQTGYDPAGSVKEVRPVSQETVEPEASAETETPVTETPVTETSAIPVDEKAGEPIFDHPSVTPRQAYDYIYGKYSRENADAFVIEKYKAAKRALEDAQKIIAETDAEKEEVDKWKRNAGEGFNAFLKRQDSAKQAIDRKAEKAKANLAEIQRKADHWMQLGTIAAESIKQRKANEEAEKKAIETAAKTPLSLREAITIVLHEFFKGGQQLNINDVMKMFAVDEESLKKQGYLGSKGVKAALSEKGISLDDFVHNILAGDPRAASFVTDEQDAINEVGDVIASMNRSDLAGFIAANREKERKEAGAYASGAAAREKQAQPVSEEEDDLPLSISDNNKKQIIKNSDEALAAAKTPEEKAEVFRRMYAELGMEGITVATEASIREVFEKDGISQKMIDFFMKWLDYAKKHKNKIGGSFYPGNGVVYIIADSNDTAEEAYLVGIHEGKHRENRLSGAPKQSLKTGITAEELVKAVNEASRNGAYEAQYREGDLDEAGLVDEILAHLAATVEQYGEGAIQSVLKKAGVTNEEFINFVQNNIANGRRQHGQPYLLGGRDALQYEGSEGDNGQDVRDQGAESGAVEGQDLRTDGGSGQAAPGGEVTDPQQDLAERGVASNSEEARFSIRYVPDKASVDKIAEDISRQVGVSKRKAKEWVKSEISLAPLILDEYNAPYLNYEGDDRFAAIKENSDYPQGTVDFNNICRKRRQFTTLYQRIQRAFPDIIITGEDLATIRNIMRSHDMMVACGLCYVEDRRQLLGEIASSFINEMRTGFVNYAKGSPTKAENAAKFRVLLGNDSKGDLSIYDLITLDGSTALSVEHPGIYRAFQAFNNARGQQAGNLFQGYAEYKREILGWSEKKIAEVNANGGLRVFSYSDFEAHHLIDLVQIVIDCAKMGVKIQGYTKVPAFARAFANTGIKINRSLIPLGDMGIVDGKLAYDPVEGIDINDPDFLESNDNVGNILIGINDEQIRLAMQEPSIHFIIPFHSNQSNALRAAKQVGSWTNYKSEQNETDQKTGRRAAENVNIYKDVLNQAEAEGTPIENERQFVERFLAVCKERGLTPRFARFLNTDEEGDYVYTPGYYKFLVDFKLFDENGNILPQMPVVPEFDDEYNKKILEDYVKGAKAESNASLDEVYDEVVDALGLEKREAPFRMSIAGVAIKNNNVVVDDKAILEEYGLDHVTMTRVGNVVKLNKLVVGEKNQGHGTRFMNELTFDADNNGWTLALTPSDEFGATSVNRLKKFYKRFGFKENKGKNTDFTINESMVRTPNAPFLFQMAYHGTGADFEKFDHSHMSEGQGSQVYGWGTYLSDNKDTATSYATHTGNNRTNLTKPYYEDRVKELKETLKSTRGKQDRERIKKMIEYFQKRAEEAPAAENHLYTVEIPDDNGQNYINWDAPITDEQSDKIMQEVSEQVGEEWGEEFEYELKSALGHGTYGKYVEGGLNYFLGDQKNYATGEDVGAERNAKLLHSLGIIGFKVPVDYQSGQRYGGYNYVIFDENDMEIVDHFRFQLANDNQEIFVSNAEAAVDRIKMDKATPEQWVKMLEKEGGLKAGEDKWLGLSDWLKASDQKTISKEEVKAFIAENKILIEETTYSKEVEKDYAKAIKSYQEEFEGIARENQWNFVYAWDEMVDRYGDDFEMAFERDGYTITPTYDYNDTLSDAAKYFLDQRRESNDRAIDETRLRYTTEGLTNKREIALTVPTIAPWNENDHIHFGDAGNGRAIAWSRFGDATIPNDELADADYAYRDAAKALNSYRDELKEKYKDSDKKYYEAATPEEKAHLDELKQIEHAAYQDLQDKKSNPRRVLFIDEIQSKRHQDARDEFEHRMIAKYGEDWKEKVTNEEKEVGGYTRPLTEEEKAEIESLGKEYYEIQKAMTPKYGNGVMNPDNFEEWSEISDEDREELRRANAILQKVTEMKHRRKVGIAPAPFEKNWHELAMKRMLRLAAEEGYDHIAWTTGDQQAERYSLSDVINSIDRKDDEVVPNSRGFVIHTKGSEGGTQPELFVNEDGVVVDSTLALDGGFGVGEKLSDIVGKEAAVKMMAMEDGDTIDGESFMVLGGNGMRGFYDDILVRFVNKYAKKWGVKTEDRLVELNDGSYIEVHSIPVTEEMKQSVMEGQPMFSVVSDQELIDKLEAEEKIEGVRELVRNADGSYVPPMATGLAHPKNPKVVVPGFTGTFRKGDWLEREEHPELVDEDGNILLVKGGIGRNMTPVKAKNDPYEHIRLDAINRQFKDAWKRPDLVFVKVQVPKSEAVDLRGIKDVNEKIARSPYIAEKAFLPVGIHDWNGGPLILSRYDKIGDEYTWEEVADIWAEDPAWKKNGIPFDNVNPALLPLLQERGIKILPPHKGMGEDCVECYKAWLMGDTEAYESWRDTGKAPKDGGMRASVVAAEEEVTDKMLDSMSPKIGAGIERTTSVNMPAAYKTDKGYYDTKSGKVSIAMDNVMGERDAIATVIHETVGHKGLQSLLGEHFREALASIYANLGAEGRSWINGYIAENNLEPGSDSIALGMMEYMSNIAKDANYGSDDWGIIKGAFEIAVGNEFGIEDFIFTDNEMNYILNAAYNHMKDANWLDSTIGKAEDILMKRELGINESDSSRNVDPENEEASLLFSVVGTGTAATDYNERMALRKTIIRTENQDADHPVRIAYDAIKEEKGIEEVPEDEDYLTIHNLSSSRADSEAHKFEVFYFAPLLDQVREIRDLLVVGRNNKQARFDAYKRVMDYMYAVSALERNAYKNNEIDQKKQAAIDDARARASEEIDKVLNPDGYHYSKEMEAILIAGINERLAREEDAIDKEYEARKRDWSGISDLMGRTPDEWRTAEAEARAMIDKVREDLKDALGDEKKADGELAKLWDRVRAVTDFNLEHAFNSGLLTLAEFETLHGTNAKPRMWDYYLPLRGFAGSTAEEEFSYSTFVSDTGRKDSPVVKKMKGRRTQAENPLANLLNIAESEIVQGNENKAKQALYRFVLHAGENSLMTEVKPWFVKVPGTDRYEQAYPFDKDPITGRPETIEDFERRMQEAKARGEAKKGRRSLKVDQIIANKQHKAEHMIRLKVGGEDKMIWVNGNPAAAKAVNGAGRKQRLQWTRRASRTLSNLFTTYSLDFTAKNVIRDTIYSQVALHVKEDKAYRHQYAKNWLKNSAGVIGFCAPMIRLSYLWDSGSLLKKPASERTPREQMFIDFMTDGGQTGYTTINSVRQIKKDLERAMRRAGNKSATFPILGHYAKGVKLLNEGFELLTRFTAYQTSRDMGRSGQRAASDAKEISVNFNRRGAQSGEGWWGGLASYLGATHYFYNAGVQGFENFLHLFKVNPWKTGAYTSVFAIMGALTPMINAAVAAVFSGDGDDDDKKKKRDYWSKMSDDDKANWYWNLPEWVRRNNIVLGTGRFYMAIPLPVELRAMYGVGDIAASYMFHKKAGWNWPDFSLDVINTVAEILPVNPVEGFSATNHNDVLENFGDAALRAAMPDMTMFFVDWATNRDYTGRPLWKKNQFNDLTPRSYGAYASSSKALVEACQKMAEWTSTMPIHIDVAPGLLRDFGQNYFGGFYRVAEDISKDVTGLIGNDPERPFRYDNIPFLSGFSGHLDEDRSNSSVTNALYDYQSMEEDMVKRIKSAAGNDKLTEKDIFGDSGAPAGVGNGSIRDSLRNENAFLKMLIPDSGMDSSDYKSLHRNFELAKMYRDGMNNQYKWKQREKNTSKGPKGSWYRTTQVEKFGVTELRNQWKEMRAKFGRGEATEQEVQDAWHEYYNAQADLADKLMEYEYRLEGPGVNEIIFNAVKRAKKNVKDLFE